MSSHKITEVFGKISPLRVQDFRLNKKKKIPISMITCYDYSFAQILNQTNIDCLLVGDSAAMTMHGYSSTLPISLDWMAAHTQAVRRGAPDKFLIGDLPFLSFRKDLKTNMDAVEALMKAGAHAVKIEGAAGNIELIKHIVESGVPVMGHLGLTPQSLHMLGGFRVQARDQKSKEVLLEQASRLENAGCFSLVLECVPESIAKKVSELLDIPAIGIGAGSHVDGQVLVLQDLLGMNPHFKPKFVRAYWNGFSALSEIFNQFDSDIKNRQFPGPDELYKDESQ
jgi:3-methyl-2-oxobutanoate hydroxymethyltransferase